MPRANKDIKQIIELAKVGGEESEAAFKTLVHEYQRTVYYLIFKIVRNPEDAQDLTQETFVKAFSSIHKFDPSFAFSTWIFKIATNCSIDFIRKKRMTLLSLNDNPTSDENYSGISLQIQDSDPIPSDILTKYERREILLSAVDKLPERYRKLVHLRYFEELSYEEVAASLQIPLGTVKAQLHRSRELLNDVLAKVHTSI